jgi:hypothetical protein
MTTSQGAASERNLADLHVLRNRVASNRALSAEDVDHARREIRFYNELR